MLGALGRVRRDYLGINRRNHEYLFRWNPRDRWALADDKRASKRLLAAHGVPTPALLACCETPREIAPLRPRLEAIGSFALKPARGAGGSGIVVVSGRRGARFVTTGGRRLAWRDLAAHAADVLAGVYSLGGREDVLLAEPRLEAVPALAAVAGGGVPDVRVLVFRGVPVLAMLRLPTRRSGGRANLHLGGVGLGVALASGESTHAIGRRGPIVRHPDSDVPLVGLRVPAWDAALEVAVRAADVSGLGYVGVDVVLDAGAGPLVLEFNVRPGLAIQLANRQGLRPLLERLREADVPRDRAARIALGCRLQGGG